MTCFMCKGTVRDGISTFTVDMGKCVVVVKNVPSYACDQCGDVCYNTETSKRLDEIVRSLAEEASAEVALASYTERAA
ncbi:MAG: type II toxin-antitoxin system MqsA family antitoxin [Treponema sp.]|nr:type II toxin-antitoxin system MqsA family antitoxin [Treponema sp.]